MNQSKLNITLGNGYLCYEKMLDDYEWLLNNSTKIQDLQQITCGTNTSNTYYGKPILPILQFIKVCLKQLSINKFLFNTSNSFIVCSKWMSLK